MNFLYNEDIPQGEYLVIDNVGQKLGVLTKTQIMKLAEEKETDAVLINTYSNPQAVRLMDYAKFIYQQQKKTKEIKKKQVTNVTKEIRISPNIEDHDLNIKIKKAYSFLSNNDKVKIIIRFRGRMIMHSNFLGQNILKKVVSNLKDISVLESSAKMEGNQMIAFLYPKK